MTGEFNFKKFIAAFAVAGMLIFDVFLGIKGFWNMESARKMPEQTEEEAVLKAEYKDKAYDYLCLAVLCGILFTGMGAILVECVQT